MGAPTPQEKELFLDASELPAEERDEFLRGACGGDAALESRIRSLLDAHARADEALEATPAVPATPFDDGVEGGMRIGNYVLVEKIGEGGFGTVWLADQVDPVRRQAAVKILKSGLETREVTARFEAERQALAMMDHPAIAKVYDGGTTPRGRLYFAMEYLEGAPITDHVTGKGLDTTQRLELFLEVCRAVQHAHQKGVIHRDLKPNNVLVTEVDGRATPKVIDFGIAKATEGSLHAESVFTRGGALIGTPAYMSPEQVDGSGDVDTRSDVYSLGVLLYELLCDVKPFDEETLAAVGFMELHRIIREVEPPKPSTRLLQGRQAVRSRAVRGDLDWIVMRCLEKDRDRRYDSAAVLANEVERFLRGDPVLAGPPNLSYRLSKFARRHRTALASVAAIFLVLVAGIVVSTSQMFRAQRAEREAADEAFRAGQAELAAAEEARKANLARNLADAEAERAKTELLRFETIATFLQDLLLSINPAIARDKDRELIRDVLGRASRRVEEIDESTPTVEASLRRIIGTAYFSIGDFDEAEPQLRRAVELRSEHLGDENLETLDSLDDLGALLTQTRRPTEALEFMERAVEGRIKVQGAEHEATMATLGVYALLLADLGQYVEAERRLRELLRLRTKLLGREHEDTVLAMNNLAHVLDETKSLEESIRLYEEALEIQVSNQGLLDPDTLKAINNLAGAYITQGQFEKGLEMLEQSLEIKHEVLPPHHPSIVVAHNNIADVLDEMDEDERAIERYRQALELAIEGHGEESHIACVVMHNLGGMLLRGGEDELAEARELIETALSGFRERLGPKHHNSIAALNMLAVTLRNQGELEQAEELAREVIGLADGEYPEGHPAPLVFDLNLGVCWMRLGRLEEAGEALLAAHAALSEALDVAVRGKALPYLVEYYEAAGDEVEAARWRAELGD